MFHTKFLFDYNTLLSANVIDRYLITKSISKKIHALVIFLQYYF
ncbi:hypothetical protein Pf1_01580 [Flavobacterium columnare]|nr:hypothetical protein Pf1_01580 [Flavobacterium columnare]